VKIFTCALLVVALALGFIAGFVTRDVTSHNDRTSDVLARLTSLEQALLDFSRTQPAPPIVYCASSAPPPPQKAPAALFSARLLPFPPENKGRIILYESFSRESVEGKDRVIFREYRNGDFITTIVPPSEIRWNVAAPTQP